MSDFQSMPAEYRIPDINASGFPISHCDRLAPMAKDTKSARANKERSPYGGRLLDARKAAGLTQAELAKKAGCPLSTIAEAETTGAGSTYTAQLAHALNVNALWLATGDGAREVAAAANNPKMAFADLNAYEASIVTAMRQPPQFSVQELTQIKESLSAALAIKRSGENADHQAAPIGVYFAVERRTHTGEPEQERRGGANWTEVSTYSEPGPKSSIRQMKPRSAK